MARATDPEWLICLQARVLALAELEDRERRHLELLESAHARTGLARGTLELAYEFAQEEGIDPALALELLVCGVAVIDLEEPEPMDESHSLAAPEWVAPVGLPDEAVELERVLRRTFRRVRAKLEQHPNVGAAIDALALEADVGPYQYHSTPI